MWAVNVGLAQARINCYVYSLAFTGPVSVTTLGGENAMFHCNGTGFIGWIVDGTHLNYINQSRGIKASSGTAQSTLTVPATLVNNGTTVQCVLFPSGVTSNNATLTILPGELLTHPHAA